MTDIATIHHLNCGTFDTKVAGTMVTHVLLCETDDGLVLVDSGIGTEDMKSPSKSLGIAAMTLNPALARRETALAQVHQLGYQRSDVRHIIATHLDYDHISGAADFPEAIIHVTATELAVAHARRGVTDKLRYRRHHLPVDSTVKSYEGPGDALLGFATAYEIAGLDHFWLIPLPGHSKGHAGVAVRAANGGWLLHAGDAFYHGSAIGLADKPGGLRRTILRTLETALAAQPRRIQTNHDRLRDLVTDAGVAIDIFCSHDADGLRAMQRSDRHGDTK